MTYQHYYNGSKIWKDNTINKWHTKIITMKPKLLQKYGKRIPLSHDIPKLLQWKQNMEREYH